LWREKFSDWQELGVAVNWEVAGRLRNVKGKRDGRGPFFGAWKSATFGKTGNERRYLLKGQAKKATAKGESKGALRRITSAVETQC